jgi:hypothetical protein
MDRFDCMTSDDIKAELERLSAEKDRSELSDAERDAAHWAIDKGLDELRQRGDLQPTQQPVPGTPQQDDEAS